MARDVMSVLHQIAAHPGDQRTGYGLSELHGDLHDCPVDNDDGDQQHQTGKDVRSSR